MNPRLERGLPWIVAAVVLGLGFFVVDTLPVGAMRDDGMYVILAKSLATGHGYRWLHVPGAPPATHFPPGYPALLALLWLIVPSFPANVLVFKFVNAGFMAIAAAGMMIFLQRRCRLESPTAAAVAVAGAIGIPTLVLTTMVLSEPLFLALLIPGLLLAERVGDGEDSYVWLAALGATAGALTLVRSHGIAFVAAIALVLLMQRRFRDAALCTGIALVVLLPWQLWVHAHEGTLPAAMQGNYESYFTWLASGIETEGPVLLLRTVRRTATEMTAMFSTAVAFGMPPALRIVGLGGFALLLAVGFRRLWNAAPTTTIFLAMYTAMILVWPFPPARFVWGVWPLVFAVPALGALALWKWRPTSLHERTVRVCALAAGAFVAFGYARYTERGYQGQWWSSIPRSGASTVRDLVIWTRSHTRPTDVVMTNDEPLVYLYADRASVPATSFVVTDYFRPKSGIESQQVLRSMLAAYHVDVVAIVASDSLASAARSLSARQPPELVLRDRFANGIAFAPAPR